MLLRRLSYLVLNPCQVEQDSFSHQKKHRIRDKMTQNSFLNRILFEKLGAGVRRDFIMPPCSP